LNPGRPLDREALAVVREEIPCLGRSCYLNTGTLGPSPRSVTDHFVSLYRRWQESGPGNPEVYMAAAEASRAAKERIGSFFGASGVDFALTGNSTDGINLVAGGNEEHPAGLLVWLHLRQTKGVRIRIAHLSPHSGPSIVEEVESLITPRTRLVAMSHVSCMTGLRVPASSITAAAHSHGVPVLFDGAQAAGQFHVDLGAIGCDFYALNGHKWLLGPVGTGALYVSPKAHVELVPDRVGDGAVEEHEYSEEGSLRFHSGPRRFEFGTRCYPLWTAWTEALDFLDRVGLGAVRERSLELAGRLREGLAGIAGVTPVGPGPDDAPELRTGIVSCRIEGLTALDAYRTLLERFDVVTRPVLEINAVRFSTAFFNTEEEVDQAIRAVQSLVGEAGARDGRARTARPERLS